MLTREAAVAADMRSRGGFEVETSGRRTAEYSSDASLYRVVPAAVAFPRSAEDIATALQVCGDHGVPLVLRGAGTSIAGNAVGAGVVLDVSRHLGAVRSIDAQARTAVVEPGVVLDDLQRAAAAHGLRFGPDPSTHDRCTIGGMIGNNACGSRALAYGRTSDNVLSLDVITGTGELLRAQRSAGAPATATLAGLRRVVAANLSVIRTELGQFSRQVSGYALEHLLPENGFDVARFLTGSEGTCAITTAATLRLIPVPPLTVLVVLGYPDIAAAADAAPGLLALSPVTAEGLDSRIVELVRRGRAGSAVPELPAGGGWLLVELAGDDQAEVESRAARLVRLAGAGGSVIVRDPRQAAALWRIREDGAGLVFRGAGGRSHYAGWEDAAVPPQRLGGYLREFEALVAQHGLHGLPYGHFGDGCVHVRLDFTFGSAPARAAFRRFLEDAADLVASYGGSMSGEHGDGRARSELLGRMYSPAVLSAFAAVKAVFDPRDLLNPGVIVRPRRLDADLRPAVQRPLRGGLEFGYPADGGDFSSAVHRCIGVGKCRADTTAAGGVMCPSYLATRDEKDSTRGRARVLQELASGSFRRGWQAPEVLASLDLCLSCKACSADCPTGTDMATYKAEVLHQRYRRRPRPASHYALGWLPRWAALASHAPDAVNALLGAPRLAAARARLAGVDPRRRLPRLATQTFRQWFARQPGSDGDPVMLWVDTFTNHFSPQVGIAAVRVLTGAGFSVQLSPAGDCCGLTWISTGQLATGRRLLSRSLSGLAPHAAAGTPIVGLEPSCVAVFRGDAAELVGGAAATTGAAVRTLAEILAGRPGWQPPAHLRAAGGIAQPHCHHRSVMGWAADAALLESGGAAFARIGGCCGLAGNFGMEQGHYEVSMAVAETALAPAVRLLRAGEIILADGFSCRTQLGQLGARSAYHLAELLAGPAWPDPERLAHR